MPYQIMTANESMPSSCRGQYRRVAVVETETDERPAMISKRARGLVRIISDYRRLNVGSTENCAYERALAKAKAELNKLSPPESLPKVIYTSVGADGCATFWAATAGQGRRQISYSHFRNLRRRGVHYIRLET